jgi:uncharacterized membrane protein YccC
MIWPVHQGKAPGLAAAGLPAAIAFNPRAVSIAEGLRAALSVAAIVAVSQWLRWPPLMEAALAAWLTCLCDAGGPIRQRVPFLLGFGIAGAAMTAAGGLLGSLAPLPVVVVVAAAGVFCTSLLRIYGQSMLLVGNMLTVVLVLALTRDLPDPGQAAELGLVFLAGSLWALLLTMAIWRLYPYAQALRAVAECWRALALLAADMRAVLQHPGAGETEWDRHAREHRRGVRTALEVAREAVLATVRTRGPVSGRAAQSWIRLEAAEQIFGSLVALPDLLQSDPRPEVRAAADHMLRRLRPVLLLLAVSMLTETADRPLRLERAAAAIAGCGAAVPDSAVQRIAQTIAERLRIAITLAQPGSLTPVPEGPTGGGWRARVLGPLRANLDPSSAALRHALRAAAAACMGFAVTLAWPTSYGYWLTITLVLTMQPYFAVTLTRAAERIGGTVLGGAVGAVIAIACPTPVSMALALFPLAVLALAVRAVNFGLFMACVTPVVVLLVELARPGQSQLDVAVMRGLYTVAGGLLALAFSALLWPAWEPARLRGELRAAIAAHGRYACTEIAALLGEVPQAQVEQARRAAGMASNNAEASLQRALLEPARGDTAGLEAALTIDAALRRMAGRVSALQVDAALHPHDRTAWQAWRDWIGTASSLLAEGRADLPPRPAVPAGDLDGESLARIARQLELAAGALGRLARPGAA